MAEPYSTSAYRSGAERSVRLLVSTGNEISGHRIVEYLGVVRGIVVRSPNIGQSFVGAFKQLVGGNISEYVDVCEAARHEAYLKMSQHAESLGADAIVAMRYDATEFVQGATEVLAYGTAVRLERA
ncbi:MAG: YbjQ family protein [Myxococcota bacterium]|nr:YbjQ family protein [Myxococcota bacterium]